MQVTESLKHSVTILYSFPNIEEGLYGKLRAYLGEVFCINSWRDEETIRRYIVRQE